jgi:sterol desaturase/sphingolipid hydroxylase (fatty acid hydroxylase superfamily)
MLHNIWTFIENIQISEAFTPSQNRVLIYFNICLFAFFIPLEIILNNYKKQYRYSFKEFLVNLYLNVVNAGLDTLLRVMALGILFYFYQFKIGILSNVYIYWFVLFILEDIAFYFEHRVDHFCRFFWAIHVTHHSSTEYNLSTGFRSSVLMPFYRFLYFVPLVLLGFHPIHIAFMYALTQTYGILVHTQFIHKMPSWFEYFFVSPSHHRVHHASNIIYLDKNMGMCLIIWDKLFGTFQTELPNHKIHYGLVTPNNNPTHPVKIIFHEWVNLWKDVTQKNIPFIDRLNYIFKPPGWSHNGKTFTAKQMQSHNIKPIVNQQ